MEGLFNFDVRVKVIKKVGIVILSYFVCFLVFVFLYFWVLWFYFIF